MGDSDETQEVPTTEYLLSIYQPDGPDGPYGDLVLLADQDRSRWDRGLIAEGQALVRRCVRRGPPGPYQIQAAINAVHSAATTVAATEWHHILQLYDHLRALDPNPIVALNGGPGRIATANISTNC